MQIISDLEKLQVISEPVNMVDENEKVNIREVINNLKAVLAENPTYRAVSAIQIGICKRVFCVNFNGTIKTFIDPVITKKLKPAVVIETCESFAGKEYLVTRPTEISAVYYTEDFKYEDNKFIGAAASLFDQQCQLLDGVVPADVGLESDIEKDGQLADLTEDEMAEAIKILKQITAVRLGKYSEELEQNEETSYYYKQLTLAEKVIDETIKVVEDKPEAKLNRAQRRSMAKLNKKKGA